MKYKKVKKPLICFFAALGVLSFGVACSTATTVSDVHIPEDEEYVFNTDMPFYSTPDAFMTLDGKFEEEQWQNCNWLETSRDDLGSTLKVTTTFTMEGVYVGLIGEYSNIVWDGQHNYPANTSFWVQIAKEDEVHWGSYPIKNHPMRDAKFEIDAKNSISLREVQYACGSYVEGELNSGETEYLSAELFVSWEDLRYTEEELGADGMPDKVRIYARLSHPAKGLRHGFSDEGLYQTYYTFDKNGTTAVYDSPYVGHAIGGDSATEGWIIDDVNKTAQSTTRKTQTLYFKQDVNGVAKSKANDYIAEVTVKPTVGSAGDYYAGLFSLQSQTEFSFYTVSMENLRKGKVYVRSCYEMDGGGWAADRSVPFSQTVVSSGYADDSVTLKLIKQGGYLYYFCNGEYLGSEFAPRVENLNTVGFYANGPAVFSDWSFEDYTGRSNELSAELSKYAYFVDFATTGQGSVSVSRIAVPKTESTVDVTVSPRAGYVLTELLFNDVSVYDQFLANVENMTWSNYTLDSDLSIKAIFKRMPSEATEDVKIKLLDALTHEVIVDATCTVTNANDLLNIPVSANTSGVLNFSVLKAGTYVVDERNVTSDGNYELQVSAKGYVSTTYSFTMNTDSGKLDTTLYLEPVDWGSVTLNGSVTSTSGELNLYNAEKDIYGTSTNATVKQYLRNTKTDGDYVATATVTMESKVGWGNVAGFMIGAGGTNYILLKVCGWEDDRLCVEVYNKNGGNAEVSVSGFTHDISGVGNGITLQIVRMNDTIYVFTEDGEMGLYMNSNGLHLIGNRTYKVNSGSIDDLNTAIAQFFAKGSENAIGLCQYASNKGVYWYDVDFEAGSEATQEIFESVGVSYESSNDYDVTLTGMMPMGENKFAKNTAVTLSATSNVSGKVIKAMELVYSDGTSETIVGNVDLTTGVSIFDFTLKNNAEVTFIFASDETRVWGTANVNGKDANVSGALIYDVGNDVYGTNTTGTMKQYFVDTKTDGDYVVDVNVDVEYRQAGYHGHYVGVMIASSANTRILLWTSPFEVNCLVLSIYGESSSCNTVISGFPFTNITGGNIAFSFANYDDVLYVYNNAGTLGFTLDKTNGLTLKDGFTADVTTTGNERITTFYNLFLDKGVEQVVGVYAQKTYAEAIYWFNIDMAKGVVPVDFTLDTETDDYTATVDGDIQIGTQFAKNMGVSVTVTSKNSEKVAKALKVSYTDGTSETLLGNVDSTTGVTTFAFTLKDNATAEVLMGAASPAWGVATVNGAKPETTGSLIYNTTTDLYGENLNGTVRQYFTDTKTDGNYLVDVNIDVEYRQAGYHGHYIGVMIAAGTYGRITLKTAPDQANSLFLNIRSNEGNVSTEAKISNFPFGNYTGGTIAFRFAMIDDVLYVYNNAGKLGFTFDAINGLTLQSGFTTTASAATIETMKTYYAEFLALGDENVIGLESMAYAGGATEATYWLDLDMQTSFETATFTMETSDEYDTTVSADMLIGTDIMKNSPITVKVTGKTDGQVALFMNVEYEDGTSETLIGDCDLTTGVTTFAFTLQANATATVVMGSENAVISLVTVNGLTAPELGADPTYHAENGTWTNSDNAETIRYFKNTLMTEDADFVLETNIEVISKSGFGGWTGVTLATAKTTRANGTLADSQARLVFMVNNYDAALGNQELTIIGRRSDGFNVRVTVTGFNVNIGANGAKTKITLVKLNDVLYVYDNTDTLVCYLDATGVYGATESNTVAYYNYDQTWYASNIGYSFFTGTTECVAGMYSNAYGTDHYSTFAYTMTATNGTDAATAKVGEDKITA